MLVSQKNEIFALIQRAGLEPRQFYWLESLDDEPLPDGVDFLVHEPTQYWFRFEDGGSAWLYRYSPGSEREVQDGVATSWAPRWRRSRPGCARFRERQRRQTSGQS